MAEWYVKDLSRLTEISVQTLHHYDRIDLLKPSIRLQNGYRLYSEKDLLKLQQVIALKFFGFELSQIKSLINKDLDALESFSSQAIFLEKKANDLFEASRVLKQIISDFQQNKSIHWKNIIKLIEVYRMSQQLNHKWIKEIFTPEELNQYAEFEMTLKSESTPEKRIAFEKSWADLVTKVKRNLNKSPSSDVGAKLGEECMNWVNAVYGKKYAHLRTKKFEKGFAEGKGLDEVGLTPEMVAWLDQAMHTYWKNRIYSILSKVEKTPSNKILQEWNTLLDDMYGDDTPRKVDLYQLIFADDGITDKAKEWLRDVMKNQN